MILVERAPLGRHVVPALPCLRDEHHHDVRETAAASDEEVDDVVEGCRVAAADADDGLEVGEVLSERFTRQKRFARAHPCH